MISSAFESLMPRWFKALNGFRRKPNDNKRKTKEMLKVQRK